MEAMEAFKGADISVEGFINEGMIMHKNELLKLVKPIHS